MATSLDKLENKVKVHHLHLKRFHMVKRLRKSVQYIEDIRLNTPSFWPCRTWRSKMSSIISGVTQLKFTKFLHDIAISPLLLMRTCRQWYCNSFSNDSGKNASGISQRSWHFTKIKLIAMATSLDISENEVELYHLHQSAFIWWKDCKNRSSISWEFWLNMPVFCHVIKKYTNEPRFLWSCWTTVYEIFTRYTVEASFALLTRTLR